MKKLKVIVIGAGNRGETYSNHMLKMPEKFEIVAVAEPIDSRRNYIKECANIPDDRCFTDFKPLLELGKIADIAHSYDTDGLSCKFPPVPVRIGEHSAAGITAGLYACIEIRSTAYK